MMDLKQIERLMVAMGRTGMKKISLKQPDGFEIELEKECYNPTYEGIPPQTIHPATFPKPMVFSEDKKETLSTNDESTSSKFITSPMVGTFYAAPSPDAPTFVKVGDTVEEGTVVCIIEAMKVMNEVKAGVRGKIVELLLKSSDPVEFGTKIFRIV